MTFISATHISY